MRTRLVDAPAMATSSWQVPAIDSDVVVVLAFVTDLGTDVVVLASAASVSDNVVVLASAAAVGDNVFVLVSVAAVSNGVVVLAFERQPKVVRHIESLRVDRVCSDIDGDTVKPR